MLFRRKRAIFLIIAGLIFCSSAIFWLSLPDVSILQKTNPGKTALMKEREEEWRKKGKALRIKQVWVPLNRISPYLINAVLIAEDDKFWHHKGIDYEAIKEALERNIKKKRYAYGASTITQQLAKNLYLYSKKSILRKLREMAIAFQLEMHLKKSRILHLYLNVAEWGEGIFGVEAASIHYFGKHASDLTPEEAVRLAAVLPSPRKHSPLDGSSFVERRAAIIYEIMLKRGIVEEYRNGNGE